MFGVVGAKAIIEGHLTQKSSINGINPLPCVKHSSVHLVHSRKLLKMYAFRSGILQSHPARCSRACTERPIIRTGKAGSPASAPLHDFFATMDQIERMTGLRVRAVKDAVRSRSASRMTVLPCREQHRQSVIIAAPLSGAHRRAARPTHDMSAFWP